MWCRRVVNTLLSCAIIILALQTSAHASIIPTGEVIDPPGHVRQQADPVRLSQRLEALGLPADVARERVARLSPREREALSSRLDQAPAGGDAIGAIAFVALVLLLTDILGLTDVYPFVTRTVNGQKQGTATGPECPPGATASLQE